MVEEFAYVVRQFYVKLARLVPIGSVSRCNATRSRCGFWRLEVLSATQAVADTCFRRACGLILLKQRRGVSATQYDCPMMQDFNALQFLAKGAVHEDVTRQLIEAQSLAYYPNPYTVSPAYSMLQTP
jgi:hypothetical protein